MATTTERGYGRQWQLLTVEAKRVYPPVCNECHQPINVTLPKTDAMSWTLDHLDARATHGTHVPSIERVRPAHRRCNSRKGAKAGGPTRWVL